MDNFVEISGGPRSLSMAQPLPPRWDQPPASPSIGRLEECAGTARAASAHAECLNRRLGTVQNCLDPELLPPGLVEGLCCRVLRHLYRYRIMHAPHY